MIHFATALLLLVPQQQADSTRPAPDTLSLPPTAAQLANAYEDDVARDLVRRARARRRTVDRSIIAYSTVARERISAALRVLGLDRTLYRRETATRIDWKREGPIRLQVLGAREIIPPVLGEPQVPEDLRNFVPHLAFDPANSEILLRLDDEFLRNPLAPNAERYYRYRSGDTTEIRLPDGRTVRLFELQVIPRRAEFHLLRGSFWIEQETNAVVQAVVRPARPFRLARDGDEDEDVPGLLKPIGFEIEYITLEYAFWDFRWWLPRTLAAEGLLQLTRLLKVPFGYMVTYSDYQVRGDTTQARQVAMRDSDGRVPCAADFDMTVAVRSAEGDAPTAAGWERASRDTITGRMPEAGEPAGAPTVDADRVAGRKADTTVVGTDTTAAAGSGGAATDSVETTADTAAMDAADPEDRRGGDSYVDDLTGKAATDAADPEDRRAHVDEETGRGFDRCGRVLQVDLPPDSATLLTSHYLSPTIYEAGADWEAELRRVRELAELLGTFQESPWRGAEPTFAWGLGAPGLVRYNRVEGLSVGARAGLDLGRLRFDATGRLALAEPRPDIELGITRPTFAREYRLSVYNGVRAVDPATRAFGIGNSLSALVLGRDDGEYYRALGASLEVRPAPTRPQWYALRLYAERQDAVDTQTDFSIPALFDGERTFRPNIVADEADLFGGSVLLSGGIGSNPNGWRAHSTLAAGGAGGDYDFGRAAVTLRTGFPLFGLLSGSLEAAVGSSIGAVPTQRLFYIGGPFTLRGYGGNAARGNAFWRARAELEYGIPAGRLALFGDAAWAGDRDALTIDEPLRSIGVGATFLNELVRVDLARALDGDEDWRLDLWVSLKGL